MGLQSYNNPPIKQDYKKKREVSLEITSLENIMKGNQICKGKSESQHNYCIKEAGVVHPSLQCLFTFILD